MARNRTFSGIATKRRASSPATRGAALLASLLLLAVPAVTLADPPATQPADDSVDWLMSTAKPAPATRPDEDADHLPTTPTASPLVDTRQQTDVRTGMLTLSDGQVIHGQFTHTAEKPLRVWVEADQKYDDVAFDHIKSLDAIVLWEREEQEWHFKESGSDIKEYSGKSYPARETNFKVTLNNGQTLTGAIDEPIYQVLPGGQTLFTLNKRDKGPIGRSLAQLVYIKHAEFDAPAGATSAGHHHHHSSEPMSPPNLAGPEVPDGDSDGADSPSVRGGATPARPAPNTPAPATQPGPIFDTH
jgi:hypothetical protein